MYRQKLLDTTDPIKKTPSKNFVPIESYSLPKMSKIMLLCWRWAALAGMTRWHIPLLTEVSTIVTMRNDRRPCWKIPWQTIEMQFLVQKPLVERKWWSGDYVDISRQKLSPTFASETKSKWRNSPLVTFCAFHTIYKERWFAELHLSGVTGRAEFTV